MEGERRKQEGLMESRPTGMPCPVCRVDLVMADRQGVEIDYCPKCRGVWLDRGELDKIIERTSDERPPERPSPEYRRESYDRDHDDRRHYGHKHKRKSVLSEIFDF
jgi:Zn-finger nucleic acid-binding protein